VSGLTGERARGFMLIEVLITASLMALISMAIISVFAAGLNVYSRLCGYSDIRADILLSLGKAEKCLRSACNISKIEFKGEPDRITFPAPAGSAPGSVLYYVDGGYLVSEEKDYSGATAAESGKGRLTKLAAADSVKFIYYDYDPKTKAYAWSEAWAKEPEDKLGTAASELDTAAAMKKKKKMRVNTPLGVRIEIRYRDRGESLALNRTVFFPLAVALHLAEKESEKLMAMAKQE